MRPRSVLASLVVIAPLVIGMGTNTLAQTEPDAGEEPAAASEAAEPSAATDPAMSADATSVGSHPSSKPEKRLHTVPEDGNPAPAETIPGWLRALLDSRGSEDLIVCVAGCSPHRDRVVHAMTRDVRPAAAAPAGDSQTSFEPTAALPREPALGADAPASKGPDAKAATRPR